MGLSKNGIKWLPSKLVHFLSTNGYYRIYHLVTPLQPPGSIRGTFMGTGSETSSKAWLVGTAIYKQTLFRLF